MGKSFFAQQILPILHEENAQTMILLLQNAFSRACQKQTNAWQFELVVTGCLLFMLFKLLKILLEYFNNIVNKIIIHLDCSVL